MVRGRILKTKYKSFIISLNRVSRDSDLSFIAIAPKGTFFATAYPIGIHQTLTITEGNNNLLIIISYILVLFTTTAPAFFKPSLLNGN